MQTRAKIYLFTLLATTAFVTGAASAQTLPSTVPSKALAAAQASCPNTLDLGNLQSNPAVLKAAQGLAVQMIGRYNEAAQPPPSLGKGLWGPFHAAVLSAMQPSCVKAKTVAAGLEVTKTVVSNVASAKATTAQTNKQVSAPPSSDASTSAVQKVGIPELLGIAVEDGAVTNNVTGTAMTLSTSPYAFVVAFGKDVDTESNYLRFPLATQIGISATFNVASSSNPLTSATRKQVSQWQSKFTFKDTSTRSSLVNALYGRDGLGAAATKVAADVSDARLIGPEESLEEPAEDAYENAWPGTLEPLVSQTPAAGDTDQSQKQTGIANKLLELLDKDAAYQKALLDVLNDLKKGSPGDLSELVQQLQADDGIYASRESEFETDVKNLTRGWNGDIAFGQKYPTTTTTSTSASSSTSTAKPSIPAYLFIELDLSCDPKASGGGGSKAPVGSPPPLASGKGTTCFLFSHGSWTGNLSSGFYTNPNSSLNEESFRGATGALQAQWSLGPGFLKTKNANDNSQMTLAGSGSYQRLQENKDQKGKRPDLVLGSLKLEIPVSSGVSFPLSISVANATEQIKETYIKGNFGISFDLDKLASLLKAQ